MPSHPGTMAELTKEAALPDLRSSIARYTMSPCRRARAEDAEGHHKPTGGPLSWKVVVA
jgi:hypothetical protein